MGLSGIREEALLAALCGSPGFSGAGLDGQADAGDLTLCSASVGLLAPEKAGRELDRMSGTAASIGGGEAAFVASGGSGRYADDSSGCVHTTGVAHSGALPFGLRLANAAVAYATYLFKMVWPANLAVFYPHQGNSLSLWTATGAALLLAGISWAVWRGRGSGYLEVGWLWYLGTLVPVSGLIQAGGHSMADRHTYIPLIGVFIMLVWGTTQLARTLQLKKECSLRQACVLC